MEITTTLTCVDTELSFGLNCWTVPHFQEEYFLVDTEDCFVYWLLLQTAGAPHCFLLLTVDGTFL